MYRYETHFHTALVSPCGNVPADEAVRAFHEQGYAGITVTDHYYDGLFENLASGSSWEDKLSWWLSGWRQALAAVNDLMRAYKMLDLKLNDTLLNNIMILGLQHAVYPLEQDADTEKWEIP